MSKPTVQVALIINPKLLLNRDPSGSGGPYDDGSWGTSGAGGAKNPRANTTLRQTTLAHCKSEQLG
ncbi:hypothetical protein JYU34_013237 [Plutella xylostella]|uniref:Uncharacterized protein n=1 Tax=Plutella xylostella TaxID=51655 RepID=A0ABQ7Q9I0_PLUXY|nr:hypothetical protein JYU34_013237 [Plutella xylostella]